LKRTSSERIENIYYTDEIIPTICTATSFYTQVSQKKKRHSSVCTPPPKKDIIRGKKSEAKRKPFKPQNRRTMM